MRARSAGNLAALAVFLIGLFAIAGPYVAMRITTPPPGAYDWVRFTAFAAPALLLALAGLLALMHPLLRVLAVSAWLVMAGYQWKSEISSPPAQDWRGVLSTVSAGRGRATHFLPLLLSTPARLPHTTPYPCRWKGVGLQAMATTPPGPPTGSRRIGMARLPQPCRPP